jgi:hypothetical protein
MRVNQVKERKRLTIPADAAVVRTLAKAYRSPELGTLVVQQAGGKTHFDLGEWRSEVASRKNDDGSISFITITPGIIGMEFVISERSGKRALIIRDAQHEYWFTEGS